MGVCMSTPLRTGEALDMMNFDGREVARARPRDARALGGAVCYCEHVLSAKGSRKAFGRVQSKHAEYFCACVGVDAPLTTRVTLNMMDFDGRELARSAKSFEVPHVSSTHF